MWKKAGLDFFGDFQFLGGATFGFKFLSLRAALRFEGVGDFVEADERKNVAVNVAEASGHSPPDRRFLPEERRLNGRADGASFGGVLDAAETRSVIEANTPEGPLSILRNDIFGDEDDLRGTADEFVLERIGFGSDEGKDSGAVGRSYGDQTFTGLELNIVGEVKAELVEVEAEAAIEIAHEDLSGMDAEVRAWRRS